MYMANANQTCVPNANYIPLVRVGGRVGCAVLCVGCAGLRGGCARFWGFVLGYTPNTSGFALQWNTGFSVRYQSSAAGPPKLEYLALNHYSFDL